MPTIVRVTNPKLLLTDPMIELFKRGYQNFEVARADGVIKSLLFSVEKPTTGLFIGLEGGELKGFAICFIPELPLYGAPQIHHFYNGGSPALRNELLKHLMVFVKSFGYNKWLAINQAGPVEAYARLWRKYGTIKELGSVMEVTFDERGLDGERKLGQGFGQQHSNAGQHDPGAVRGTAEPGGQPAPQPIQHRGSDVQRPQLGGPATNQHANEHLHVDLQRAADEQRKQPAGQLDEHGRNERRRDPDADQQLPVKRVEPELPHERYAKPGAHVLHQRGHGPTRKRVSKRHAAAAQGKLRRQRAKS